MSFDSQKKAPAGTEQNKPKEGQSKKSSQPHGGGPTPRGKSESDIGPKEGPTGVKTSRHSLPGDDVGDVEIPEGTV